VSRDRVGAVRDRSHVTHVTSHSAAAAAAAAAARTESGDCDSRIGCTLFGVLMVDALMPLVLMLV